MKELGLPKKGKITKEVLMDLYTSKKYSTSRISSVFNCSENKINYWLKKFSIQKRSISDAIYQKRNPEGDPFCLVGPKTLEECVIYGLGLGIYWGEGLKRGKGGVRLTNTDPKMVKLFIKFLVKFFSIDINKLRFSIQIFEDIHPQTALNYWMNELGVKKEQFYKTILSRVRGRGTYKYKSEHGVIIVYFNNVKLKKIIIEMLEKL
ncbi:MAG: hypothetical protein WCO30_00240 [bacterium]